MRRRSLLQTVPHSEDNLGNEEEKFITKVPHSEDNLGDEEDKFITNSTTSSECSTVCDKLVLIS
jgi:hypothetical protein